MHRIDLENGPPHSVQLPPSKRGFDIIDSFLAAIFLSPLLVLVALLVRIAYRIESRTRSRAIAILYRATADLEPEEFQGCASRSQLRPDR